MRVKVRLFATLVCYVPGVKPGVPFEVELPDRSTLADLMNQLSLPRKEVKVAFVSGRTQPLDFQLQHGNEVGIFPLIGGG
jgi:molybdopterin synthase sulfur carrier subunit